MLQTPQFLQASAPKEYQHQGESVYFDRWQKRFVPINDFQQLKQYIGTYLEEIVGVPSTMIQSAMPYRLYRLPSDRIGDFVVEYYRQGKLKPLMLIKCTSQHQEVTQTMITRAYEAAMELGSRYVIVTNGTQMHSATLNGEATDYVPCNLQSYRVLIPEKAGEQVGRNQFIRQNLEQLRQVDHLRMCNETQEWEIVASGLKDEYVSVSVNLAEAYLDVAHKLVQMEQGAICIEMDLGLRYIKSTQIEGIAPGGYYRSFLVKGNDDTYQVMSFLVTTTQVGKKTTTALFVLFDQLKTSYQVLQLDLGRNVILDTTAEYITVWHNGRLAKRRQENEDMEPLYTLVEEQSSDLLVDGKIQFIPLRTKQMMILSEPTFAQFTCQLMNYSLIRDTLLKKI
ncbi:MAG: hypothetical protein ACRDAO_02220 [Culicoidibacterales bacterium]